MTDYEVIEHNGDLYGAMGWNGEYYSKCYKLAPGCTGLPWDRWPAKGWKHKYIALKPAHIEDDYVEYKRINA